MLFIWQGGKAQAQSGYNDDLVMSLGIGLFTRDTGIKFHQQGMDITRRSLDGISKTGGESNNIPMFPINMQNPFQMEDPYGGVEDITWLL